MYFEFLYDRDLRHVKVKAFQYNLSLRLRVGHKLHWWAVNEKSRAINIDNALQNHVKPYLLKIRIFHSLKMVFRVNDFHSSAEISVIVFNDFVL